MNLVCDRNAADVTRKTTEQNFIVVVGKYETEVTK